MELQLNLPPQVVFILQTLQKAGHEAYIVGGAVRDVLLFEQKFGVDDQAQAKEATPDQASVNYLLNTDFDFTTDATPDQILKIFPESFYENDFGTVMITFADLSELMGWTEDEIREAQVEHASNLLGPKNKEQKIIDIVDATKIHESLVDGEGDTGQKNQSVQKSNSHQKNTIPNYEITTFRSDGAYEDGRHPESVTWGKDLKEDVDRRDFTINAMALKLVDGELSGKVIEENDEKPKNQKVRFELIDHHQGAQDLEAEVIRTVGDPNLRFKEDALRILRAIRFSVQLNMSIEDQTYQAIKAHAHLIKNISWERIRDEFFKIIKSDYPAEGIDILDEVGLLEYILPELLEGKGIGQSGHHTTDVWTHNLDALRNCPSPDPIVRLSALLHDVGKPRTRKTKPGSAKDQFTFYNHEIVGSRMASKIAKRFHLSKKDVARVFNLVRQHMFYYQPHHTDAAIRRFMRKVGLENVDDILDLREGDRLGSGAKRTSWRLEEMKQRMIEQLHQPMEVRDLAIDGNVLMSELKVKPGPVLGKVLNYLFELVMENPELNDKAKLLELAKEFLEQKTD